jgi:putative transcriptional regulator
MAPRRKNCKLRGRCAPNLRSLRHQLALASVAPSHEAEVVLRGAAYAGILHGASHGSTVVSMHAISLVGVAPPARRAARLGGSRAPARVSRSSHVIATPRRTPARVVVTRASESDGADAEDKDKPVSSDDASSGSKDAETDGADDAASLLAGAEDDVAPALEGDWRDFRAMLVSQEAAASGTSDDDAIKRASGPNLELLKRQNPALAEEKPWAHEIGAPERGCLLVARGDEFTLGQQYFHQAVILILDHSEKGSMGVILNRPTQYSMGYVSGDETGPFAENALYFGGDVGDGTVSFLHGSSKVRDSAEILPGVYLGGYESACELVKDGEMDANECKFFARYCGWGPGQLVGECERGVWHPVACSKQLALKQVIQLPKPLWREVSELVGGEMEAESRRAYGEEREKEGEDE